MTALWKPRVSFLHRVFSNHFFPLQCLSYLDTEFHLWIKHNWVPFQKDEQSPFCWSHSKAGLSLGHGVCQPCWELGCWRRTIGGQLVNFPLPVALETGVPKPRSLCSLTEQRTTSPGRSWLRPLSALCFLAMERHPWWPVHKSNLDMQLPELVTSLGKLHRLPRFECCS